MGQFLSNKYMKYRSAMNGELIDDDKLCDQCGQNVRGLRYGGACPECGTPIILRADRDLPFHEMPLPLIKQFRVNSWIATFAVTGFLGLLVFGGGLSGLGAPVSALIMVFIGVWIYAVWRLTPVLDQPQAAAYGFSRDGRFRLVVRWLQLGWVAAAVSIPLGAMFAGSTFGFTFFLTLFFVGLGVGLLGLACFIMFLRRFAGWVGDEFAERAFHLAVWGNLIAIPLAYGSVNMIVGLSGFMFLVVSLFVLPVAALLIASLLAFPVGLISLSRSVDWSVVHSRREAARARELRETMAPRPAPLPEQPQEIELTESQEHRSTSIDPAGEEGA